MKCILVRFLDHESNPLQDSICSLEDSNIYLLVYSPDIVQCKMKTILEWVGGTVKVVNDVIVHGKNDAKHDAASQQFMEVYRELGLVFNAEKRKTKAP